MNKNLYEYIKEKESYNILLHSDGGSGKTTQMIYAFKRILFSNKYSKDIPIYIDVKMLDVNNQMPIFKYLAETFLGKNKKYENLDIILSKNLGFDNKKKGKFVFFIDGLNETTNKKNILNDINKLKQCSACSLIVSSRIDEENYVFEEFERIKLEKLKHHKVVEIIKEKYEFQEELSANHFEISLLEILEYPLFLKVFCMAYDRKEVIGFVRSKQKVKKTDIINAYTNKILKDIKSRKIVDENEVIEFSTKFFLPRLAFLLVQSGKFVFSHQDLLVLLNEDVQENISVKYFTRLLSGKEIRKFISKYKDNIHGVIEHCLNLAFLKYNEHSDTYEFLHHIWRDYFASWHIVNLINANYFEELLSLPNETMIRGFVGEMYKKHGRSECDYIEKTNCISEPSPIESYMKTHYIELNQYPSVIANLIDIMKISRENKITASYDNLNLEYVSFVGCKLPNSSFNNSKIYENNFYAPGHSGYVYAATITPDNERIVSCGKDSTIRIWDVATQKQVGEPLKGHKNYVVSVKTIDNGQVIISGSYDGTIRRWSATTHKQIGDAIVGHEKRINQIAVTNDEKHVVSCSSDATIRIWSLEDGVQEGKVLHGHIGVVNCVCVSPDDKYIISAGEDGTIRVWDFSTCKQSGAPLLGHNCSVKSVCVTFDGKYIISADQRGEVCVWNMASREQVGNKFKCSPDSIESIASLPDGSTIIVAGYDGKIRAFDIDERILIAQIDAHGDWINGIGISDDGKFIVSAGGDQAVKLWDANTFALVGEPFIGTDSWINSVKISSNSQYVISAGDNAAIRIWDVLQKRMICEPLYGHTARINEIDISSKGIIVSASDDGTVGVWDVSDKSKNSILSGHSSWVRTVLLCEDGKFAVSGGWDCDIIIWDLMKREMVKKLPGHNASVEALALVSDNGPLISGSDDGTIRFWDIEKGKECEKSIEAHDDWIRALKLTHDKRKIVTASWDNTIRLWDVNSHINIGEPLKGHTNRIDALAVSKDNMIISGSDDNTVRVWKEHDCLYEGKIVASHDNAISSVSISNDSSFVVSGDGSGNIKVTYLNKDIPDVAIRQLGLNVFNSDLSNIRDDSEVSKDFLSVLYQNGCLL